MHDFGPSRLVINPDFKLSSSRTAQLHRDLVRPPRQHIIFFAAGRPLVKAVRGSMKVAAPMPLCGVARAGEEEQALAIVTISDDPSQLAMNGTSALGVALY